MRTIAAIYKVCIILAINLKVIFLLRCFYYDVLFPKPISAEDLPEIEKEMLKIISKGSDIKKNIVSKKEAFKMFSSRDETYKISTKKGFRK